MKVRELLHVIARSVRDEAIQLFWPLLDCFAPLAMTVNGVP